MPWAARSPGPADLVGQAADGEAGLARIVGDLATAGKAVVVSTHDVEFVAAVADRVVVMADGDVVADGTAGDVLAASPAFAPQVAKILAPLTWLTVRQVAELR